jgi:hypothetical protein
LKYDSTGISVIPGRAVSAFTRVFDTLWVRSLRSYPGMTNRHPEEARSAVSKDAGRSSSLSRGERVTFERSENGG